MPLPVNVPLFGNADVEVRASELPIEPAAAGVLLGAFVAWK